MPLEEQVDVLAGRYRLGKVIGRGGMADVYRAEDELLEREVAVKVLRARTATERDRARFETEAKTVAQFDHPHLVTLLDAGINHDTPYLVMDLVEGPSLAAACADGPLPPEQVGGIGAALCEALNYVHGHDVVHRDLKPGNVLLGSDGRVRLADFGIARLLGDTAGHTATGTLIGTAAYLAPEQVKGLPVSPASDIYSLGLLLLEALTGVRAYTGTPTEAALARLHNPPAIPDDVPEGWPDLIRAMTSLEPAARPAAKDAAIALQRLAQAAVRSQPAPQPTPQAEPEPAVQPERRPVLPPAPEDRRRAADSPPGTHSFPVPDPQHPDHPEHAARPRRRGRALAVTLGVAAVLAAAVLGVMVTTTGHGGPATPIPSNTPPDLRAPLSDLHAAVAG
jgi:serine/threonine protein kinase